MHGSKQSSGMVESRGGEADGVPRLKGFLSPVHSFLSLGCVSAEPELQ